jgi:hypothetical protein
MQIMPAIVMVKARVANDFTGRARIYSSRRRYTKSRHLRTIKRRSLKNSFGGNRSPARINYRPTTNRPILEPTNKNRTTKSMFQIIEVFLGFSIGVAILWVTILALIRFTRRVMDGEEWQDVLKDLWKKQADGVLPAKTKTEGTQPNGQTRRKNL